MILGDEPIGELILRTRISLGMTRTDLQNASGVPSQTIGRIESGVHSRPEWASIVRIFAGMNASVELTFKKSPAETPDAKS